MGKLNALNIAKTNKRSSDFEQLFKNSDVFVKNLHTDQTTDGYSDSVQTSNKYCAIIEVVKMGLSYITIQMSSDNVTWENMPVYNIQNGTMLNKITTPGKYLVYFNGLNYIRSELLISEAELVTVIMRMFTNNIGKLLERERPKQASVATLSPTVVRYSASPNIFYTTDYKNGYMYGFGGTGAWKSNNGWTSANQIGTYFAVSISNVKKLDNGAVLVWLSNGELWKSDTSEANFVKVHTVETTGAYCNGTFGVSIHGNKVFYAEYGSTTPPNNARRVYASSDYGATWAKIFEGPQQAVYHTHDVAYDPYEDVIWIVTGDAYNSHSIKYSTDGGVTWNSVYAGDAYFPVQFTKVTPLPNCVLFATDCQSVGVWRYNREALGIRHNNNVQLDLAFLVQQKYHTGGTVPIGTHAATIYGDNPSATFGWSEAYQDAVMKGAVYTTRNGYDFYKIWEDTEVPIQTAGTCGVAGVYYDATTNAFAVNYLHKPAGQTANRQVIKIENPW